MNEKGTGFEIKPEQRQSWLSIAMVWAGGMICVPSLMVGGVLSNGGLSMGQIGTRLKPLTDRIPKALVSVGGEPLLKRVIFQLKDAGFTRIVVNVHHFSQQIIDYLREHDNFGLDIRISDETDKLLETGGGIRKAWALFDSSEPILIHNVDILSNVNLKKFYQMESQDMIAARLMVSERKTKRYLLFDDSMRLVGWTNIETGEVKSPYPNLNPKDYKMYAFSGIHMVAPSLFPLMEDEPDKFPIMDFYLKHCDKVRIEGYVKNDLKLMDVGKQETLKEAEAFLKSLVNSL